MSTIAHQVSITKEDIRDEARRQGIDPDKWNYLAKPNGYFEVRKGFMGVGELIFEDMAQILVDEMNKRDA